MTGFKGCPCHADCVEGCEKCENPICNCKVKDLLVVEAVNLGKKIEFLSRMPIYKTTGKHAPIQCVQCSLIVYWNVTLWTVKWNASTFLSRNIRIAHARFKRNNELDN